MAIPQYQVCPKCGSDYEPPFICDVCYNKLYSKAVLEDTAKRVEDLREKLRADKEAEKRDLNKKKKKLKNSKTPAEKNFES